MRFPARFARVVTVIGAMAALGSALMPGAPAAQASPNESTRTAETGAADDVPAPVERVFVFQPDSTAVEVPPESQRAARAPYYRWKHPAALEDCDAGEMCLWTGDHYTGVGLFMGGDLSWCEGFRFEHTIMQDDTDSIWNSVTGGPSSIWNRASDGTYRYQKYGLLQPGYHHDTAFSNIMDAWAFDPANTCSTEYLALLEVKHPD